jgi:hypothetical protein
MYADALDFNGEVVNLQMIGRCQGQRCKLVSTQWFGVASMTAASAGRAHPLQLVIKARC